MTTRILALVRCLPAGAYSRQVAEATEGVADVPFYDTTQEGGRQCA